MKSPSRSVISGGALSLVRLATGVVRVKVLALALGVEGVGLFAILLQLYQTGVAAVSLSLAVPIINLGRPKLAAGALKEVGQVVGTASLVLMVNAIALLLLAVAFGHTLLAQIGVNPAGSDFLWPIALAIIVGAAASALGEGMSYLTDRFDTYVRAGMVGAVGDMLLVAGGAALFGLRGAVLGMALGTLALLLAYAVLIARDPVARQIMRNLSAKLGLLPQLLGYSAMMFATVAATNAGLTFLRSRVLIEAGATANGYLQTVTSLSAYLLAFVMTGFWGHLYPLAAAYGDTPQVRKELSRSLNLGLLIGITGCGVAAVLAPHIIPLFYSRQFSDASPLLVAYLPGELCFQLFSMLIAYQLTVSFRRLYLGLNLGYVGLLVLAGVLLIPAMGAGGYVAAHVGAAFGMAVVALAIAANKGQVGAELVARAAAMIIGLTAACGFLIYARNAGYPELLLFLTLIPFAASGAVLLLTLWREWHPVTVPPPRPSGPLPD